MIHYVINNAIQYFSQFDGQFEEMLSPLYWDFTPLCFENLVTNCPKTFCFQLSGFKNLKNWLENRPRTSFQNQPTPLGLSPMKFQKDLPTIVYQQHFWPNCDPFLNFIIWSQPYTLQCGVRPNCKLAFNLKPGFKAQGLVGVPYNTLSPFNDPYEKILLPLDLGFPTL